MIEEKSLEFEKTVLVGIVNYRQDDTQSVSYTHLTLPTTAIV